MNQEISAWMDGEAGPHESESALRKCCASEEALRTWQAYHLIGDALRGQSPSGTQTASRVMAALAQEPTVLAPRARAASAARIGLAAAASVATVAVVGWIGVQGGLSTPPATVAKAPAKAAEPVLAVVTPPAAQPPIDVQDYLVAHRQLPSPDLYRQAALRQPAAGR